MRTHSETITMTFHSMIKSKMVLKNIIGTEFATFEFKTLDKSTVMSRARLRATSWAWGGLDAGMKRGI
jgi:hypothetical protein